MPDRHPADVGYERSYEEQVLEACRRIGYGRVQQLAEQAWAALDPKGVLTGGPAQATLDVRGFRTCSDLVDAWDRQRLVATGRMGYRDGLSRENCPFGGDSDSITAWTEGWDEANSIVLSAMIREKS